MGAGRGDASFTGLPPGFHPRPELVSAPSALADVPRRVIDFHNHLGHEFGGGWCDRGVTQLLEVLDEAGVEVLVDLDGGWSERILDERLAKFKAAAPARFACFAGIDWSAWPEAGDAFPELAARRLAAQVRRGAEGLKVWKPLGLTVRDGRDRLVPVDDERLDPVWQAAAALGVPVTIHVADPVAYFRPLDETNERYLLLRRQPEWHFHGPEFPSFQSIMEQFERLVHRHRETRFVGAHVGCYAENLAWVSRMLDECPNYSVDISARLDELGRQPYSARAFISKHADRVLFGADCPPDADRYRLHYRFLETADEHFAGPNGDEPGISWRIHGLHLPDDVLRRVYFDNAARLLRLPPSNERSH